MEYKEKEIALLIELLRTALGGPAPTLPENVDWEHLYALAVAHKVEAMACAAHAGCAAAGHGSVCAHL